MIVCAGDIEQFSFATPIGIGLVNSAINLTRLCIMNPPEFILFVGSAGSYGKHNIFDIVYSRAASNIEHSFIHNQGYTPLDNLIVADDVAPTKSGAILNSVIQSVSHETIVNSSNYITASKEASEIYLKIGLSLESMEFFSVLSVAKEFNIPVGGVFVVTNYCNKNAHKDFIKNHKEAMEKLELHLRHKGIG
jgi:nucleoside phosphorylase